MENSFSLTMANNKKLRLNALKDRVLSLSNLNLVTEEEINDIISTTNEEAETERDVFRLLMEKDISSSIKILEILKNEVATVKDGIAEDPVQQDFHLRVSPSVFPTDNPMKISAIIHNVFRFLKLADIKNCRYVSQEWNHVAEPFLRKRSQISFGYPANWSCFSKTSANFNYVFRFSQENMPFTALKLTQYSGNDAPWPLSTLKELLESWGSNMKELTIDHLTIQDVFNVRGQFLPLNLTDLFPECNITKLNLRIQCHHFQIQNGVWDSTQRVELSLEKLINIQYLCVSGCILKIKDKLRISPIEIEIQNSSIIYPSEDRLGIKNVLNKFIDFRKVKRFLFHHRSSEEQIDLKGNFELEFLSLSGIRILNWNTSNWKIGQLNLCGIPFSGQTSIYVQEITVTDSLLSLADIPETVEKLVFNSLKKYPSQVSLPNLTELVFYSYESNLKCFENCPKLTSLQLKRVYENDNHVPGHFSLSEIPPNVRKLFIGGPLKICGNWNGLYLEKLILDNISVGNFRSLFKKFRPEKIVISLQQSSGKNIALFKLLGQIDKCIAIGKFKWSIIDFPSSSFSALVDKQSEYYLFNDNRGITIDEDDFKSRMQL